MIIAIGLIIDNAKSGSSVPVPGANDIITEGGSVAVIMELGGAKIIIEN